MFGIELVFQHPWYLLLLVVLLPVTVWWARGSLAGLGRTRRTVALALRVVVMVLIVCALSGMQVRKSTRDLTVVYLLDQSLSIPASQRRAMLDFVNTAVREHKDEESDDRVGVIIFGRDAAVEYPPDEFFAGLPEGVESDLDSTYTDLAGAMRRAQALFTGETAKRIVILSDGNENLGDSRRQARALADASVSIDVVPVHLPRRSEVSVEKVSIPAQVRREQPFDLRVVLSNEADEGGNQNVRGKVRIVRKTGEREETVAEESIELQPGKRVLRIAETIDQADFYTYEAQFIPDNPAQDGADQNNSATTFTHVRGRGHVLLIEDFANPGEFGFLVDRLKSEGLEVTVQGNNRLFTSLPQLQRYDSVILANVPRSSGSDADLLAYFSDAQISILVRNTQLGCGLIMLGGPNSFGAGGWTGTELEKAMPVDFQIKSKKIAPVGALALMMHAGEIPESNYWQKRIAQESIKALGHQDYCGLVQWNGTDQWLWGLDEGGMSQVGPNRQAMLARIDRMNVGDMPAFDPAMRMAAAAFARLVNGPVKPSVRHMIIISDGDPTAPSPATMSQLVQLGVKVSTVAVGSHGILGSDLMQKIAEQTGGKYYVARSSRALPKIYQREIRKVAQPLIHESQHDLYLQQRMQHEMLKGVDSLPPIRGFVMTSLKDGALPEVLLSSPEPTIENGTILAAWQYDLGKAVAFTTDTGRRWANAWTNWPGYDRFFSQMVRWSMRPTGEAGNYTIATNVEDGQTEVVVTALDQNDEFLNYQSMNGMVVAPDMEMREIGFRQVAPGRYVANFDSAEPGAYSITVLPGVGQGQILTGVNVGYSNEFRDRTTNVPLLQTIASTPAKGGTSGQFVEDDPLTQGADERLEADPFRKDLPPATSVQDIWPLLVFLSSFVFFADVFVRRVQVDTSWIGKWNASLKRRFGRSDEPAPQAETLSRLQSRKKEVDEQIDERAASARFERDADAADHEGPAVKRPSPSATKDHGPAEQTSDIEAAEEETYTSRLLKAKKDAWKNRGRPE